MTGWMYSEGSTEGKRFARHELRMVLAIAIPTAAPLGQSINYVKVR